MVESAEYYKALAASYQMELEALLKPDVDVMVSIGVVVSMLAEVEQYGAKNGVNKKYTESRARLKILFEFLQNCSSITSRANILRLHLEISNREKVKLKAKIDELETKIHKIDEFTKD